MLYLGKSKYIDKKGNENDTEFVYSMLSYAVKGLEKTNIKYEKSVRYFEGDHKIKENDEKKGNRVYNKYAELFENRISHLTEALPKFQFKPQEESDIFKADALNQVIGDVIMDEWEQKGEQSVTEAAHAGFSVIKSNVRREDGYPVFTVIPCGQGLPDPAAKSKKAMRFFIHLFPMTIKSIKKEYKFTVNAEKYFDVHRPTMTMDAIKSWENHNDTAPSDVFDIKDVKGFALDEAKDLGQALVIELWYDSDEMEEIPFDVEQANDVLEALHAGKVGVNPEDNHPAAVAFFEEALQAANEAEPRYIKNLLDHLKLHLQYPQEEKRKKYPYGKVITCCQGNSRSDKNPIKIPWRDVFILWNYFPHPQSLLGKGLGDDLFDPQDTVNHRVNAITKNINNLNNGVILLRQGVINSLVKMKDNLKKLTNAIGLTIPVTDVQRDYKRDFGPALQSHHFLEVDFHLNFMEVKSGHEGLGAGRLPPGSPAGITVEQLLGESRKPINAVIRRYSFALKEMAVNAMKIMSQFMDEDEIMSILYTSDQDYNTVWAQIPWKELKDTHYKDIRVEIINDMGASRARKFSEAVQLAQFGVYDPEDVLDALDDPKKYKIIQRKNTIAQLQAALEQVVAQNEQMVSEIKTMRNREQGSDGSGNAGEKPKNVQNKK